MGVPVKLKIQTELPWQGKVKIQVQPEQEAERTLDGKTLLLIPYFLWGNRGESQMTVWVRSK